jgi:acyl-coenzyme A thioesterase PaaI-like protein
VRRILNPYTHIEGYNCFGCSPNNENGLQMKFVEDGEYLVCDWEPRGFLQGFFNVLHGGIQATLLDEIGFWTMQIKLKTAGVTSNMNTRLKLTVPTDKGKLKLRAKITGQRRNLVDVRCELFNPDGKLAAWSDNTYFSYPPDIAKEKLYYPDYDDFFED